jgi:limonene-1,2-epoxide hydrolase
LPRIIKVSGKSGNDAGQSGIGGWRSKAYLSGQIEAVRLPIQSRGIPMPLPIETVSAFCAAFAEDGGRPAVRRWFTPQTRWVNEGLAVTTGVNEAIGFIDGAETSMGIATVHIDILTIVADGNRVLTERVDRFERADGSEIGRVRLMGIFELEGEKIVAWRDYYDVNAVQQFGAA